MERRRFGQGHDARARNAFRALKVAAARIGLPEVGLHTLRHSAASVLLTHGVPLKVVSEILGLLRRITGDVYEHVTPDVSREALDIRGDVLGKYGWPNGRQNGGQTALVSTQGPFRIAPETAPDLHFRSVGLTGFEPATP
jgi:hypothetical protein